MDPMTILNIALTGACVLMMGAYKIWRQRVDDRALGVQVDQPLDPTGVIVTYTMPNPSYPIEELPHVYDLAKNTTVFVHISSYITALKDWTTIEHIPGMKYNFKERQWKSCNISTRTRYYPPVMEIWDKLYSEIMFTPKDHRLWHQDTATIEVHEVGDYPPKLKRLIEKTARVYEDMAPDERPDTQHQYRYGNLTATVSPIYVSATCKDPDPDPIETESDTTLGLLCQELIREFKQVKQLAKEPQDQLTALVKAEIMKRLMEDSDEPPEDPIMKRWIIADGVPLMQVKMLIPPAWYAQSSSDWREDMYNNLGLTQVQRIRAEDEFKRYMDIARDRMMGTAN